MKNTSKNVFFGKGIVEEVWLWPVGEGGLEDELKMTMYNVLFVYIWHPPNFPVSWWMKNLLFVVVSVATCRGMNHGPW